MIRFGVFGRARHALAFVVAGVLFLPAFAHAKAGLPGADLFEEKGCSGCHSIGGEGGDFGPKLDTVGDRYGAEWLFTWLNDPSAVKPGTEMPKLDLTNDERALLVFYLLAQHSGTPASVAPVATSGGFVSNAPDLNPDSIENAYLDLGTKESYAETQRGTLQDQITSFIPPLLEPAFTQSAFVLPPGAARIGLSFRDVAEMDAGDFSGQSEFGARVVDFDLKRRFFDIDALLGFDNNFTVRLNVPLSDSRVTAEMNPAFMDPISVFPQGGSLEVGDVKLFAKKKLIDQGNFPFGLALMGGVSFPTGSNDERFDGRTTVKTPMGDGLLPLPALDASGAPIPGTGGDGTFRRFSNDGRLPAPLQPGLGTFGGTFGIFGTRVMDELSFFGRGALHAGAVYQIRPEKDGVDPGNVFTGFATVVKPIFGDELSFDLTYLAKYQEEDSYDGLFAVPNGMGGFVARERPSFSGGLTQSIGGSFIWSPNPLFRVTLTGLAGVDKPRLGPSPDYVIRLGLTHTFASDLFQ